MDYMAPLIANTPCNNTASRQDIDDRLRAVGEDSLTVTKNQRESARRFVQRSNEKRWLEEQENAPSIGPKRVKADINRLVQQVLASRAPDAQIQIATVSESQYSPAATYEQSIEGYKGRLFLLKLHLQDTALERSCLAL